MPEEPVRVVIIDDHPIFRSGLRAQFETDASIEVVDEFATADEAVAAVLRLRPTVTLMDLRMPRRSGEKPTHCGVDAIREILRGWPTAIIIVVTAHCEIGQVREALSAGVRGYLLKEDDPSDFVSKMLLAARGSGVFSPAVTDLLPMLVPEASNGARPFGRLGDREHQILELLAQGMTNDAIARRLSLSPKTVANRISEIYTKLDVDDREAARALALDKGLGTRRDGSETPG